MKKYLLLIILSILFFPQIIYSQTCQDASVELSAIVQSSPPKIILNWRANANATNHIVYRKLKSATSWGSVIDTLAGTDTQFIDSTVSVGISYEYKVVRTGTNFTGYGYINSGIEIPVTENRGIIILIVDTTFVDSLSFEIARLEKDFEGDGWKIIRHDVSPSDSVPDVKALIVSDYNADPANTKAIFILGHVPVPYSGNINPDGHPDHLGAWPADVYYGTMTGTWTDASINSVAAGDPRNRNIPGDGKFDQSNIPADVILQIGRVDFYDMPAFASSEMKLMQNYLNKDHDYRNKVFTAVHRAIVDDNFGYFGGEAFAASGWRNLSPLVGTDSVSANDYFTSMTGNSYLWSYGCGGGSFTSAGGIGTTTDFAASNLQGVFTMLFGSYFGDWGSQNNFLRAPLAQGTTLTNVWSGRPHWQFHHMGLGENIGYDVRISQNNTSLYYSNFGGRSIHNALMGDPTLRNDIIAPVSNVVATANGNNADITWTASLDTVSGYNIYMKNDSENVYIRVNQNIISGTSFTDSCLLYPGIYTYMVRAIRLEISPSGSYYNMSEGIGDTTLNNNYLAVTSAATFTITNNDVTFINASVNANSYFWIFGDSTTSNQPDPVHNFPNGNYSVLLIASNGCDIDTLLIPVSLTTGIESTTSVLPINIFPNPASESINVRINDSLIGSTYVISDMSGKIILAGKLNSSDSYIMLNVLTNGVYMLRTGEYVHRIFKIVIK